MNQKVTVFGAGRVGAATAQRLVERDIADVVLIDIVAGMPQAKAMDMMQSAPIEGFACRIRGSNDPSECRDSDLVVIASGVPRRPGMTREDILPVNAGIVSAVCENIKLHAPQAVVIVVTNPLEQMTQLAAAKLAFPKNRVMGMGVNLDSARFRYFLATELGVAFSETEAVVLGGHGEEMVPIVSRARVGGRKLRELLSNDRLDAVVARTRRAGTEILERLKDGNASFAPSSATVELVRAVLRDEKRLLPVAAYCNGQYDIKDVFVGVPCILGKSGVERVVEWELADEERAGLQTFADRIRGKVQKLHL